MHTEQTDEIVPALNITTYSKFYLYLFVQGLDSLNNYSFSQILFFKMPFYPYCFTPKITPLSLMIFFLQNFYPFTLSLLFVALENLAITCILELVQLRKAHLDITEKLLTGN